MYVCNISGSTYIHIFTYIDIILYQYQYIYILTYINIYIYIHIYIYIYIYIYIQTVVFHTEHNSRLLGYCSFIIDIDEQI